MSDAYDEGLTVRREVLGDAHVDRSLAGATEFTGPWQEHITATAWGQVWARPGLDRRTRSMLTVALLAGLGHEAELALHIQAAIRNKVTPTEIREVLIHTSVYAGVPAANSAFAVAQKVLLELDTVDTDAGSGRADTMDTSGAAGSPGDPNTVDTPGGPDIVDATGGPEIVDSP